VSAAPELAEDHEQKFLMLVPATGAGTCGTLPAQGTMAGRGLTDARRPDGALFTEQRGLREAIIERGEGTLRDDATALLLEWRRGSEQRLLPATT
jgi:hypothetical protein